LPKNKTACECLCIDFSRCDDATQCLAPEGITQRPWKQGIGETEENSQKDCSRYTDGNVPYVYWLPNTSRVYVNACTVDNANPTNGLRQKF